MKLLIDGVEIPWPKLIEIQVDEAGETVGPLYVELSGGRLVVQGNAEHTEALTLIENVKLPDGSWPREFLLLRAHGWEPEMGSAYVWNGDQLAPVTNWDSRTKTLTLAEPVENPPTPDVVAGG